MKQIHSVKVRVHIREEENEKEILDSLLTFFPFDLEKEKLKIETTNAKGFGDTKIKIINVTLSKERHTKQFLNSLLEKLDDKQKETILDQAESRLDENIHFFLRFNKDELIKEKKLVLTDSGKCFHIMMSIACFPSKREKALEVVKNIFRR